MAKLVSEQETKKKDDLRRFVFGSLTLRFEVSFFFFFPSCVPLSSLFHHVPFQLEVLYWVCAREIPTLSHFAASNKKSS